MTSKAQPTKEKKLGITQIRSIKGNDDKGENTTHRVGENICASLQGRVSRRHNVLINPVTKDNSIYKNRQTTRHFSEGTEIANKHRKTMLNLTSHQGNAQQSPSAVQELHTPHGGGYRNHHHHHQKQGKEE